MEVLHAHRLPQQIRSSCVRRFADSASFHSWDLNKCRKTPSSRTTDHFSSAARCRSTSSINLSQWFLLSTKTSWYFEWSKGRHLFSWEDSQKLIGNFNCDSVFPCVFLNVFSQFLCQSRGPQPGVASVAFHGPLTHQTSRCESRPANIKRGFLSMHLAVCCTVSLPAHELSNNSTGQGVF